MSAAAAAPPSVAALERASHSAVPAARVAFDGPFVIRAFLGGTGRANAASSLDPASDPELPARQARIAAHYARLGLPARFRSTPLDPPGLDALLRVRGFAERDETCVLAGPLDAFAAADDEVEALDGPTEAWLSVVATADYQTEARREEKTRAPAMLVPPAAWMLLRARGGVPAASVFVVADGPLAGFFDLAVRPEFQRQGLARRTMAAAASWARARGAAWGWGQVAATNAPSLALNRGLGLREAYRYRYFIQG